MCGHSAHFELKHETRALPWPSFFSIDLSSLIATDENTQLEKNAVYLPAVKATC